jgi:hypothetical protein
MMFAYDLMTAFRSTSQRHLENSGPSANVILSAAKDLA